MNQLPQLTPEIAASREDFELFRRLLRVARLLNADNFDALCNQSQSQSPAFSPFPGTGGEGGGFLGPSLLAAGTPHPAGLDGATPGGISLGDYDNDDDDDEYNEPEEDEDEDETDDEFSPHSHTPRRRRPVTRQSRSQTQSQSQNQGQPATPAPSRAGAGTGTGTGTGTGPRQQKQERPHAAVEKRYRSMINSKIQQLNAAIPPSNTFSPLGDNRPANATGTDSASQKMPTKSVVLDRGIQYLNHLISTYEQTEKERNELRATLQNWLELSNPGSSTERGSAAPATTTTTTTTTANRTG
ncbi:hypothetical protein BJY04DRAFT_224759 [Aspergillus karnatakaensis]|uniref:basic helix-loop-helix domain-containing protein n=1 Tax=Aspergillus karnatakaensis TaxID=1810916 RepID=UPI003CCD4A58